MKLVFNILLTVLALFPNLLIGYLYINKDAIIEQQKEALMKGFCLFAKLAR